MPTATFGKKLETNAETEQWLIFPGKAQPVNNMHSFYDLWKWCCKKSNLFLHLVEITRFQYLQTLRWRGKT